MPYIRPMEFAADDFMVVDQDTAAAQTERIQEREVRLTAQRVVIAHLRPGNGTTPVDTFWPDIDLDLTGAVLIDVDMQGCKLRSGVFTGAQFVGYTCFDQAEFADAAVFYHAEFESASFQ